LRSLGCTGIAEMVDRHCALARRIADGLCAAGYQVLNRVPLNHVLVRAATDDETTAILQSAQASGECWF
jgi:glutamate/tyrosine decarboxylase-like PLP-dependent enzyme